VNRHPLSDRSSLSGLRRRIRADLSRAGADPSLSFDCLVAVTEACTNALLHGLTDEDGAPPDVSWHIDDGRARFCIQDFSTQRWSKHAHPARGPAAHHAGEEEQRFGGFGLDLMRELMDEVDISVGPGGTRVVLVKELGERLSRS
jgi:serine/threonine-protein kinase RsbW